MAILTELKNKIGLNYNFSYKLIPFKVRSPHLMLTLPRSWLLILIKATSIILHHN